MAEERQYVATRRIVLAGRSYLRGEPTPPLSELQFAHTLISLGDVVRADSDEGEAAAADYEQVAALRAPTEAAVREAGELGVDLDMVQGTGQNLRVTLEDVHRVHREQEQREAEQRELQQEVELQGGGALGVTEPGLTPQPPGVDATEAAQNKAAQLGVDLAEVQGSGSGGRVGAGDVTKFASQRAAEAAASEPVEDAEESAPAPLGEAAQVQHEGDEQTPPAEAGKE